MCGIFGVIANNDNVKDQIFDGLRRLEYRGYDSSGIATINNDPDKLHKVTRSI